VVRCTARLSRAEGVRSAGRVKRMCPAFERAYVSRGGEKLAAALDHFRIDPTGRVCADLGCSVGGFTDCLLQRGATKVYAVDTAYGELAWKLRTDARVVVKERTNALHLVLPEPVSLVAIDVGWTRQHLIAPQAHALLEPGGVIVTLIKPHYEADRKLLHKGVLPDEHVDEVVRGVVEDLKRAGLEVVDLVDSPIRGQGGNREVLGLIVNSS
jgi:23S rRNA (cytidine1920-2'-O)/16S rRNA (cytidine1409-2'-O)-methyltransferase